MKKIFFLLCACFSISCLLSACAGQSNKIVQKAETAKVQVYEGCYFDSNIFGDSDRADFPKTYCEIIVSNVTDTSFDFTVNEVNYVTEERELIFQKNTAIFIGDGTEAIFYGTDYTLSFTFPDYHEAYPVATDMEITGFEKLEGKTYTNSSIPGHEFG